MPMKERKKKKTPTVQIKRSPQPKGREATKEENDQRKMKKTWRSSQEALLQPQQAQELVPRLGARLEAPQHAARDGGGAGLLDAAHHHAQVLGLHDDGDALGPEDVHDGAGDVLGEALLDLEAARVDLCYARELGEADDAGGGYVADVHLPLSAGELARRGGGP